MSIIKEPLDVDFEVNPRPLTEEEKEMISNFIRDDKLKRKSRELHRKLVSKRKTKHKA